MSLYLFVTTVTTPIHQNDFKFSKSFIRERCAAVTTATTATTAATTTTTTTLDPAKLIVQLSKRINKVISERTREQKAKTDETTFSIQNRFVVGPKNFFFEKP